MPSQIFVPNLIKPSCTFNIIFFDNLGAQYIEINDWLLSPTYILYYSFDGWFFGEVGQAFVHVCVLWIIWFLGSEITSKQRVIYWELSMKICSLSTTVYNFRMCLIWSCCLNYTFIKINEMIMNIVFFFFLCVRVRSFILRSFEIYHPSGVKNLFKWSS